MGLLVGTWLSDGWKSVGGWVCSSSTECTYVGFGDVIGEFVGALEGRFLVAKGSPSSMVTPSSSKEPIDGFLDKRTVGLLVDNGLLV